ncbi:hypothetical protein BGZ60DRAFT_379042 [Tricladium varicosporioides]|nr:hypothetical protein BGZ60DRAFT_379042 [Hymenoscyphus varicosporioides]
MTDYTQLKVPDLKKILQERGLVISGNKADLIARLQEHDKKASSGGAGEDEIDWDEDDNKVTTAPADVTGAAGGQGKIANPTVIPNQKVDTDPSTATDTKATVGEDAPKAVDGAVASTGATTAEPVPAPEPEAPKQNFTAGIPQTDAEKEAAARAARAKRFGIPVDDEAKRLAERAKKFGVEQDNTLVKGLDSALPERRPKRGREGKEDKQGRNPKRQTPDRRTGPAPKAAPAAKKASGRVVDDPTEKAKAEARAKRFQTAA